MLMRHKEGLFIDGETWEEEEERKRKELQLMSRLALAAKQRQLLNSLMTAIMRSNSW
jgi:hypothetical protein